MLFKYVLVIRWSLGHNENSQATRCLAYPTETAWFTYEGAITDHIRILLQHTILKTFIGHLQRSKNRSNKGVIQHNN